MRSLIILGATLVLALCATAVPAFTADTGDIDVTITAQAPPAPCLVVSPGSVDFGTRPFSASDRALSEASADITFTNCGTVGQNLLAATSNATGTSGIWEPIDYEQTLTIDPCVAPNRFYLSIFIPNPAQYLIGLPRFVRSPRGGPPMVYPVGDTVSRLTFTMPCQGSNGAGETKSLNAFFTAVVA